MIKFENISKKFGKLQVLNEIDTTFKMGQSIAIVGPNGSGKTTLIKILLGMVLPDKGNLFFNNLNTHNTHNYRGQIGYMPQISLYPPNLKIRQLVKMMTDIRMAEGWNGTIDNELFEAFELKEIENKPVGTLSGGSRQKVGATLAFRFDPSVLVLDEPTAGLDPVAAEILKEKIQKERAKGKLILITSHIVADLDELTDHMLYMQDTRIQFFKKIEELKDQFGGEKLNKIIAHLMKKKVPESNKVNLEKIILPQ